jgi:hypothetical protein
VIVGISPEGATTMVQLSLEMRFAHTALDLEEGLARLGELTGASHLPAAARGPRA